MTGAAYLAASVIGVAGALTAVARATGQRNPDRVSPVLACDLCPALVTAETAHHPHEAGCAGKWCQCDRLVCASCCDDPVCIELDRSVA